MQTFYENKKVFVTGGSGFLGRVFIEKILRATDVECIYMLIRPKKNETVGERITQLFDDVIFEKLRQLKPNALERVKPILGDCTLPNLGLSASDRAKLIENVHVVVHCAATVRFEEPLYNALMINVRATNVLIELAKEMLQLKSFVHVSSAFANCPESYIKEKFYTHILGISAESALKLAELLGPNLTNALTPHVLRKFPNTYTYTKALAEDLVLTKGAGLPICIFRPAIIASTYTEPIRGWTNNLVGPMALVFPVMYGFVHSVYVRLKCQGQIVPVDFCANCMLACAWETATATATAATAATETKTTLSTDTTTTLEKLDAAPRIYNFVPHSKNGLTWKQYVDDIQVLSLEYPFTKMLWYPFAIITDSLLLHNFLSIVLHVIPFTIFDFVQTIRGKRLRLMKFYHKYRKGMDVIDYFKTRDWRFNTHNTDKLWASLMPDEKTNFNFNMMSVHWMDYNRHTCAGMRLYLAKDKSETLPKAIKRLKRLHNIHRASVALFYTVLLLLIILPLLHLIL